MANWVADFLARNPALAARPIALRARRSIHFDMGGGLRLGVFTGAPCHYDAGGGDWRPLDTALQYNTVQDDYGAPGLRVRFDLHGRTRIVNDSGGTDHEQQTLRVGILNTTTGVFSNAITVPGGVVSDDCIIRTVGPSEHRLRLTETGIRETLTLGDKPPAQPGDLYCIETVFPGQTWPDGPLGELDIAGYHFPLPRATDAAGAVLPVERWAKNRAGVQYVYTGIRGSVLAGATYPLVLDPDFLDSTNDGYIYSSPNSSYATAHTTSSGFNAVNTAALIGQTKTSGPTRYSINGRMFVVFDTSAIGAGSTVTQVNLTLTCNADFSATDFDVDIVKQDWSAQRPLSDANREAAFDNCLAGTLDDQIWRNTSGMATDTPYASGNLAVAWVNKTGSTYYSLISSLDYAGTTPTDSSYVQLYTQEVSTSGYRPVLTVAYTGGTTNYPYTGTGGATTGGTATTVYHAASHSYTATGGGTSGGAATISKFFMHPYVATGGATSGGSATTAHTAQHAYTASGGAASGGAATTTHTARHTYLPTGGATSGGAATTFPVLNHVYIATGGATSGGVATTQPTHTHAYLATGGGTSGGAATTAYHTASHSFTGTGGATSGGAATTAHTAQHAYTATGGITSGGAATTFPILNHVYTATGGATTGGVATTAHTVQRAYTATGGATSGGAAATQYTAGGSGDHLYIATGGATTGGVATTAHTAQHVYIATSGITSGGVATIEKMFVYIYIGTGGTTGEGSEVEEFVQQDKTLPLAYPLLYDLLDISFTSSFVEGRHSQVD